jgi:hypothetical protein
MGDDYKTQLFYDFESGRVVASSQHADWDLSFESNRSGSRVFMNGGKGVNVFNTGSTDFDGVSALPNGFVERNWLFDSPCGLPDSTAIGNWFDFGSSKSRNEVFIVRIDPQNLRKVQFLDVNDERYVIKYAPLTGGAAKTVSIPKDSNYSRAYFNFLTESQPKLDPPKGDWDIVFTRYRYIYYHLDNFPYQVTGVLLNPYNTLGAQDSTSGFENVTAQTVANLSFTNRRDVIGGFGWKEYSFVTSRYEVFPKRTYVIRNRNNRVYKIHFLDFYDPTTGAKGSPSFEFERLQ